MLYNKKTMNKKKSFFYFPTWSLILLFILFVVFIILEILFFLTPDFFEKITVNGIEYVKGTPGYFSALKKMKQVLGVSILLNFLLALAAGWFGYKRIKNK